MFVTNHVLSGVLIGRALERRPVVAFVVGVGSHLALDALPHWGCSRQGPEGKAKFMQAARRDGLAGLTVMAMAAMATPSRNRTATVAAMAGAALLDLDKPLEIYLGVNPFPKVVNRVHKAIQNESPEGLLDEFLWGAGLVVADIWTVVSSRRQPEQR
jgi:hypothetical protein